ncbi:MAG TPA: aconitate hydratase AcnA [Casimicrobiaceae bacterium]|jgi:aconitate hydratase
MASVATDREYDELIVGREHFAWLDLERLLPLARLRELPYSMRILLENVARCSPHALAPLLAYLLGDGPPCEVPFQPNRLMLHDTTCLPALADFAGMRDAVAELGGDPGTLNPTIPVVLTIDHSVIVEKYASADAVEVNLDIDYRRNSERYRFIKWAEQSLRNFRVVPPGTGIIHQVNMESLAQVVWESRTAGGARLLHPDDMVATDSHTPMINALGVVAWGVGGLEGQAAMLGEPVPIVVPQVVGLRVTGALRSGVTGTDLALHLTALLRKHGVVGKFVELCGPGLDHLDWATRGTVANMAPEYGATVVYFPFDNITLDYLRLTGRTPEHLERIAAYMTAQRLWRNDDAIRFDEEIRLDLATVEPCLAGPYLPHERQALADVPGSFRRQVVARHAKDADETFAHAAFPRPLAHGALVLAAITSCTNTSNAAVMVAAGLLARNARRRGLRVQPWVKTSLSPGSRTVADYLRDAGLMDDLEALGFHVVGFGCMTCIGSSGPLEPHVEALVDAGLVGAGVLSGNRNFEGRINPKMAAGYLASPPLVVAYAIVGTVVEDIERAPLGHDADGAPVFLRDVWPTDDEVRAIIRRHVQPELFAQRNRTLWLGTHHWQSLAAQASVRYAWDPRSTYLRRPQYTQAIDRRAPSSLAVRGARVLLALGDNVTTDHISPVGRIPGESAAGRWLLERGEAAEDLNQYSTRRSNHEVMLRGAFTTPHLRNLLLRDAHPVGRGAHAWTADRAQVLPVYEAARTYQALGIPLVVVAGMNYGAGSSRDWAAKAPALLGVKAVIARSFERIHRSNLIGMGVFPLEARVADFAERYRLTGRERLAFENLDEIRVGSNDVVVSVAREDGATDDVRTTLRVDSLQELTYLRNGGVLPYVVRKIVASGRATP